MLYFSSNFDSTQLALRGSACSFCLKKLTRPFCHFPRSEPLFSRTCITDWKAVTAQSGGFALDNIHLATSKAIQMFTVELTAGGEFKTFTLYANLDITMYFHVNNVSLHESQIDLGAVHTYIRHISAKQAEPCDWQSPFLPVYVALHLFAPSLGYFSRRGLVCRSACVPRIQMKATICKVSVRGESVKGSSFSVWH